MVYKNRTTLCTLATALAALVFSISAFTQSGRPDRPQADAGQQEPPPESLYFTAERMENLSTYFRAVTAAGLTDTLKGPGPFTVFAPTDEAFAKLPAETLEELFRPQNKEMLRAVLIAHIYATRATGAELSKLKDAVTLKRAPQSIDTSNGVKVGGAGVIRTDIIAENGIIHLIDTVLMPADGN